MSQDRWGLVSIFPVSVYQIVTDGLGRMCFDGGSSYSGYGQLGFDRRVRVYQLSEFGEKIETYKRLTSGEVVDRQVLVGSGAPVGTGQDQ